MQKKREMSFCRSRRISEADHPNMRSIGLDLDRHVKSGLLEFQSFRPGLHGLEMHLASLYKMVRKFKPQSVVVDPITNLVDCGPCYRSKRDAFASY
jgi:hypothetical protein